jgi:hypothetical protein
MFLEDLLSSPQTTQLAAIHAKSRYSLTLLPVASLVPWSTAIGALDFKNKGQEPKKMNQDLTRQFTSSPKKTRPRRSVPLKRRMLDCGEQGERTSSSPLSFDEPHPTLLRLPCLQEPVPFIRLLEELSPIIDFSFSSIDSDLHEQVHSPTIH